MIEVITEIIGHQVVNSCVVFGKNSIHIAEIIIIAKFQKIKLIIASDIFDSAKYLTNSSKFTYSVLIIFLNIIHNIQKIEKY